VARPYKKKKETQKVFSERDYFLAARIIKIGGSRKTDRAGVRHAQKSLLLLPWGGEKSFLLSYPGFDRKKIHEKCKKNFLGILRRRGHYVRSGGKLLKTHSKGVRAI